LLDLWWCAADWSDWSDLSDRSDDARVCHALREAFLMKAAAESEDEWRPATPPATRSLATLAAAARDCTACPLYKHATQTVFGEGPRSAKMVLMGEQPGDQEDRAGQPFVGPAGTLLNRALEEAGISRNECYVTNAVKHFKWEPRGKRRLHKTPSARDMAACRPWFEVELVLLKPQRLVLLGATAAKAVFGPAIKVTVARGRLMASKYCERTLVTVHPSSLLRAPSEEERRAGLARFVADLRVAVA
jgi:DNA polymerase